MYADDFTLYTSDIFFSNLLTIIQKDLNRVLELCYKNKMNLNAQKTKCMLVGSSHKLSKSRDLHLTIGDYKIDCVNQYKLLDVNLDNNLKWSFHVDNIHKKTNQLSITIYMRFLSNYNKNRLCYNNLKLNHEYWFMFSV